MVSNPQEPTQRVGSKQCGANGAQPDHTTVNPHRIIYIYIYIYRRSSNPTNSQTTAKSAHKRSVSQRKRQQARKAMWLATLLFGVFMSCCEVGVCFMQCALVHLPLNWKPDPELELVHRRIELLMLWRTRGLSD